MVLFCPTVTVNGQDKISSPSLRRCLDYLGIRIWGAHLGELLRAAEVVAEDEGIRMDSGGGIA